MVVSDTAFSLKYFLFPQSLEERFQAHIDNPVLRELQSISSSVSGSTHIGAGIQREEL